MTFYILNTATYPDVKADNVTAVNVAVTEVRRSDFSMKVGDTHQTLSSALATTLGNLVVVG